MLNVGETKDTMENNSIFLASWTKTCDNVLYHSVYSYNIWGFPAYYNMR